MPPVGIVSPGVPGKRSLHAHKDVASQARELCLSAYEALMAENAIWLNWQARFPGYSRKRLEAVFVALYLFRFVPAARAMMAARLAGEVDEGVKAALYDALVLDATLTRGRGRGQGLLGQRGSVG